MPRAGHILADIIRLYRKFDKRVSRLNTFKLVEKIVKLRPVFYFFGRVYLQRYVYLIFYRVFGRLFKAVLTAVGLVNILIELDMRRNIVLFTDIRNRIQQPGLLVVRRRELRLARGDHTLLAGFVFLLSFHNGPYCQRRSRDQNARADYAENYRCR